MLRDFVSGDLVRSDRPAGRDQVPEEERKRIGLVLCHVPKHIAPSSVAVAWFGPRRGTPFVTFEPDHRLAHV